ncbi:MAG: flippase-like domain-containing protein [Thermoplasmatales archaeon]|nr:MAG: flippase-like domain-containing protein [Thermoplasmatales archaeon]
MGVKKLLPIIGIVLLLYILSTMDVGKIIDVFLHINLWYAILSILAIVPVLLIYNFEWQLILKKHSIKVSYTYSLKNTFIGFFYGFITPGGLGGYTRALHLKDESGETIQKCFVNLLIINTIDYLTLLSLGVFGGFLLSSRFPNIFPIFLFAFIVVIGLISFFIRKNTGKLFFTKLLKSKLLTPYKDKWNAHINNLYEDLPSVKDLIPPYLVSLFGWFFWLSELYLISFLFSIDVPFHYFFLVVAVANVIASLPITIYGLGTRDAAMIGMFSIFNVPQENILGFSLFWFVIFWLIPSLVGAVATIHETRKKPTFSKKKP